MANSYKGELRVSGQNALAMALKFILKNFKNVTFSVLEKEHGLSRRTLYRIQDGGPAPRCYDTYMRVCVHIINEKRRAALTIGNQKLCDDIDLLLRDMMLVHYGEPTDEEIRRFELKKKYGVS